MKFERPWGFYINLHGDDNSGSKVKKIVINPGKRLSLQSHIHRCEHWIITKGNPDVQLGQKVRKMKENEYVLSLLK